MPDNYNDETHRKQAQPDHIVPLKQLHEQYKHNYALDDSDLKRIANSESNLAITSAEINQVKRDMTNKQYIEWMDEHGKPLDENTKKIMLQKQKELNIEKVINEKEDAIKNQDFEKAASLRDNERILKEDFEKIKNEWRAHSCTEVQTVDEDDIAKVVSIWTKVPVERLTEKESDKILHCRL